MNCELFIFSADDMVEIRPLTLSVKEMNLTFTDVFLDISGVLVFVCICAYLRVRFYQSTAELSRGTSCADNSLRS